MLFNFVDRVAGDGARARKIAKEAFDELSALKTETKHSESEFVNIVRPNGKVELGNDANEVRVHADAVRVLFGQVPFLWQQYTLLKAEDKMRFEQNHPDDYAEARRV